MRPTKDPKERFISKVNIGKDDDCWEYNGAINSTGRGAFSIGRKNIKAHRFAYEMEYGEIPPGMCVCHHCDNGKCCNPKHLFLGTIKDNVTDMIRKGRKITLFGEHDPKSRLKEKEVLEIVRLYKTGKISQFKLADMFRISRSTVEGILFGRTWKRTTGINND